MNTLKKAENGMNEAQGYLSGVVMACLLGAFGIAHANEVAATPAPKTKSQAAKPAAASKAVPKAAKSAKSAKPTKSAKSAKSKSVKTAKPKTSTKTVKTEAAPLPVAVAAAPMPARSANPYLPERPANPYLAYQTANPYLTALPVYTSAPMPTPAYQAARPANAATPGKANGMQKISLSPLPIDIYMQPNQKPTVAFTTPCVQIQKASHGFPPFTAVESFMFEMVGKINDSNGLPVILEPVCV
jgi:hypothetical protein